MRIKHKNTKIKMKFYKNIIMPIVVWKTLVSGGVVGASKSVVDKLKNREIKKD